MLLVFIIILMVTKLYAMKGFILGILFLIVICELFILKWNISYSNITFLYAWKHTNRLFCSCIGYCKISLSNLVGMLD